MFAIPQGLIEVTRRREGEAGDAWLAALPQLVDQACRTWGCTISGPPVHGEVALVLLVERAAGPATVKISYPHPGNLGEAAALRHFDGAAAVHLLDASADELTLLLERAGPATLASRPTAEAIEVAGRLARRLATPAAANAPSLSSTTGSWLRQLEQQAAAQPGLVTRGHLDRARGAIRQLSRDTGTTMLHGDLHFDNVLAATREPWLVIDPKGWRGTPAFETFTVIAGHHEELEAHSNLPRALARRISRFATAAEVDPELALQCCQARATSAYLHQGAQHGSWFDVQVLRALLDL